MLILNKVYRIELAKTLSAHWYSVWEQKGNKEKFIGHYPSSTTILLAYPQSTFLTKWIGEKGNEEAERIRDEAGISGTKIHIACDLLEDGQVLSELDYTTKEWVKINSFVSWFNKYKPNILASEIPIFNKKEGYAGRADRLYEINGQVILLDLKSSSAIHDNFFLQVSSYAKAIEDNSDTKITYTAILQLGASNKDGYRYVLDEEWRNNYKVFQAVKRTWEYDNSKQIETPPIITLPPTLKLN